MMSIEKLATATIKNRAEASKLYTELNRIDKEKRNELRMLNNEKQRFRTKYLKNNFSQDSSIHEAADVKMYETHNPGFCFKRNGEHKVLQQVNPTPMIDFEHLQFLLFTDGEVDIEKLLCLHLLSTHETEHLTLPESMKKKNSLMKKETPLEMLIERSDDTEEASIVSSLVLPVYVLDVQRDSDSGKPVSDSRLTQRLLINEKIMELVTTVISTLKFSNPEKLQHLLDLAQDASSLKRIFRKPEIQDFIAVLMRQHYLISSCSSFILTQKDKIQTKHIEIRTVSGALEELVSYIRANVLRQPNINMYKESKTEEASYYECEHSEDCKLKHENPKMRKNQRSKHFGNKILETRKDSKSSSDESENAKFRRVSKNFIVKNIMGAAKTRKLSDEEARIASLKPVKQSSKTSENDVSGGRNRRGVIEEDNAEDMEFEYIMDGQTSASKRRNSSSADIKYHLKQTTCPACMEKWRTPLPSPKISSIAKSGDLEDEKGRKQFLKTDSQQRLSLLIEREQFKLNAYDKRYSNVSNKSSVLINKKPSGVQRSSNDLITLDVYDLEKIRQEIREREVSKKLQKFLGD